MLSLIERIKALGPEEYARRVEALVAEGLDHSDAEAVVDAELIQESPTGFESAERQWFALCADGNLAPLGDHGDYEAADDTARDLGLEVVWLIDGPGATQWAHVINAGTRAPEGQRV